MIDSPCVDAVGDVVEGGVSFSEFMNAVVYELGGAGKFARELVHEYNQLPEGSPSKVRVLTLLVTLWAKHGAEEVPDDLESLKAEAARLEQEEAEAAP